MNKNLSLCCEIGASRRIAQVARSKRYGLDRCYNFKIMMFIALQGFIKSLQGKINIGMKSLPQNRTTFGSIIFLFHQ